MRVCARLSRSCSTIVLAVTVAGSANRAVPTAALPPPRVAAMLGAAAASAESRALWDSVPLGVLRHDWGILRRGSLISV